MKKSEVRSIARRAAAMAYFGVLGKVSRMRKTASVRNDRTKRLARRAATLAYKAVIHKLAQPPMEGFVPRMRGSDRLLQRLKTKLDAVNRIGYNVGSLLRLLEPGTQKNISINDAKQKLEVLKNYSENSLHRELLKTFKEKLMNQGMDEERATNVAMKDIVQYGIKPQRRPLLSNQEYTYLSNSIENLSEQGSPQRSQQRQYTGPTGAGTPRKKFDPNSTNPFEGL